LQGLNFATNGLTYSTRVFS